MLALWSILAAMKAAFQRDFHRHAEIMRNLYWRGLVIAGLFNFLPGRTTNRIFFDDMREAGYVVIVIGGAIILADVVRKRMARAARTRLAA